MKKTSLTALAVALAGISGVAHAQSTVTLYGLIDAGIAYSSNSNGSATYSATSGALNGSRWGLKGQEDLGGGLKAIFVLENGFSVQTGGLKQNSRLFGRQAFVGLSGNETGSVTLGRQYDSVVDYLGPLALNGTQYGGTIAAHPYDNDNLNNQFRVSNSVKFQSINYAGFQFGAMYGFSNDTDFANNRAYSVGGSYAFGGLKVAAGYLQLNGANSVLTTAATGAVSSDATFNAARQRTYGAGVNYAFGAANVGFVFTQTQLDNASLIGSAQSGTSSGVKLAGSARFTNYEVNGRYNLTPTVSVAGAYTFTDARLNGAQPKFNQVTLQTAYALSKRTDVYAEGAYQHVSEAKNAGISGADIVGFTASNSDSQVVATVGIRHRF